MDSENYLLRGTRNTLLDMLHQSRGTTYPLADLPASAEEEMVYFNNEGTIRVAYHQPDVSYQVFEGDELCSDMKFFDDREDLLLKTKKLTGESHAFKIVATKIYGEKRSKVLYKVVNIKVGINTGLEVTAAKTQLNYNEKNSLTIKAPQKGAKYYISYFDGNKYMPLSEEVLCKGGDMTIETIDGIKEDIILRVSASDPNTGAEGMLDAKIEIKVSPDLKLPVSWHLKDTGETRLAIDYGERAFVRLKNTQSSALYHLFLFQKDGEETTDTRIGDEHRGNDGDLDLPVTDELTEDLLIGIVVLKPGNQPELDKLKNMVIIPVKPNALELTLISGQDEEDKNVYIRLTGAQPGVIYQLYKNPGNKPVGDPVFYHRNIGVGKTRVGGDYIADNYKVEDGMKNWVKSEFVIDEVTIEESKILLFPAGEITETSTFYVVAKKSTTGFTETLPEITVTIN